MNSMRSWFACLLVLGLPGLAGADGNTIHPSGRQFFALSVPDAPKSAAWYQRAFGVKQLHEIRTPDGAAHILILGTDDLLIEVMQLAAAKSPGAEVIENRHLTHGIVKVGMYVKDFDAAVAHLRGMGATFDTKVFEDRKLDMRSVLIRDPDGNIVQLFTRLQP